MKKCLFLFLFTVILFYVHAQPKVNVARQMQFCEAQYKGMLQEFQDTSLFPQSTNKDGSYNKRTSDWWCSGFFSGNLWYLYEYSKDSSFKNAADKWAMALQKEQFNTSTHDLGFMLYCSFGNGYRLTGDTNYRKILLKGAGSLATRFNPKVGLIKSWDTYKQHNYPVIIDNMMNLEYLCWASKISGNPAWYQLSVTHADNTLKNQFRKDNSSFHVICYDSTGGVEAKMTAQGYADSSAWARGQAWGLYGYTVMYRETKNKRYLDQARKIAAFFMNHPNLPKDKIPYWDFNSPEIPNDVRDASAAAVVAAALLELQQYVRPKEGQAYFSFAEEVLVSLSSPAYFAEKGNNHFLLKHSTGHKPVNSEIDVPLIYADYYYLEALLRYDRIVKGR
jgi:hypothetical protein